METFPLSIVHGAVCDALRLGAIRGACPRARQRRGPGDAVKHLALCRPSGKSRLFIHSARSARKEAATQARPYLLSASADGHRGDDIGVQLYEPAVG